MVTAQQLHGQLREECCIQGSRQEKGKNVVFLNEEVVIYLLCSSPHAPRNGVSSGW